MSGMPLTLMRRPAAALLRSCSSRLALAPATPAGSTDAMASMGERRPRAQQAPDNEYGGLKSDQVRRMKDLETENQRLRKAIADLTLDKLILQEAARGN